MFLFKPVVAICLVLTFSFFDMSLKFLFMVFICLSRFSSSTFSSSLSLNNYYRQGRNYDISEGGGRNELGVGGSLSEAKRTRRGSLKIGVYVS